MKKILNYIDGSLVPPKDKNYLDNINPSTGGIYSQYPDSTKDDINLAYKAIIEGSAEQQKNPLKSIKESYAEKITDEFFKPKNFSNYSGVKKNDGFFITNYRADRVRELLTAIFDKQFNKLIKDI